MRRALATLYAVAGALAACCLVAIAAMVAVQIGARLLDAGARALGLAAPGFSIPSLTEIAGYLLAAASFLALADTLAKGVHIRVTLALDAAPEPVRRGMGAVVGLVAALVAGYGAFALGRLAAKSFAFGDVSYGLVAIPLGVPQAIVALGLGIAAVAFLDEAAGALAGRAAAATAVRAE